MTARQITTAAELDALPVGSVVLSAHGAAWQRLVSGWRSTTLPSGDSRTSRALWASFGSIRKARRLAVLHDPSEPNDGPGPGGQHSTSGECFACMVGVATGPESHAYDCPTANPKTLP